MSVSSTDNKPGGGREDGGEPTGPGSISSPQNELMMCYFSGGERPRRDAAVRAEHCQPHAVDTVLPPI